jgi:hypothetical protein
VADALARHGHGFSHSGSRTGFSDLLSTVAHAAIWSTVGRFIWHAPVALVVVLALAAAGYLVLRRRA